MSDPVSLIVTVVLNGIAYYQQRKKQRSIQEQLKRDSAPDIKITGSAQVPLVLYGRTAIPVGLPVYSHLGNMMPNPPTNSTNLLGSIPAGQGDRNEYLANQWILSEGEIQGLIRVLEQDRPFGSGELVGFAIAEYIRSSASTLASDFHRLNGGYIRNQNTVFAGRSYMTTIARRDRDDPKFYQNGISPYVVVDGVRVKTFTNTNNMPAVTDTVAGTRNAVAILYDYMTNDVYGEGFSPDKFDVASWQKAYLIANQITQGPQSVLYNMPVSQEIRNQGLTDAMRYSEWFDDEGFDDENDSGYAVSNIVTSTSDPVRRFEFNGRLDTNQYPRDNRDIILTSLPNIILYQNDEDQWVIDVPDSMTDVDTQPTDVITADDLVDTIIVNSPNINERVNSVTVTFANANKDLAADTVTFPTPDSNLDNQWLAADNNVRLREEFPLPGVINEQMANSIAASLVLTSRRRSFNIKTTHKKTLLKLGDIVRLEGLRELSGVATYGRIVEKKINDDFTISFLLQEFNPIDYGWYPSTKSLYEALQSVDNSLGDVENVLISANAGLVSVVWDRNENESSRVVGYEIEKRIDNVWSSAGTSSRGTTRWESLISVTAIAGLAFRVRPMAANGQVGNWVVSSGFDLDALLQDQIQFIYTTTTSPTAPATPTSTVDDRANDNYVPAGWTSSIPSISSTNTHRWVSQRRGFPGAWSDFEPPALHAAFGEGSDGPPGPRGIPGEDGLDGDPGTDGSGFAISFLANDTGVEPPRPSGTGPDTPTGWFDGVPLNWGPNNKYLYVVISTKPEGVDTVYSSWSSPSLFLKWGEDGAEREWIFYTTENGGTPPPAITTTAEQDAQIDYVPPGALDDYPNTLPPTHKVVWWAQRRKDRGALSFNKFGQWALVAKFTPNDGTHQTIFTYTNSPETPSITIPRSQEDQPGLPSGVTRIYRTTSPGEYRWGSIRYWADASGWGDWSAWVNDNPSADTPENTLTYHGPWTAGVNIRRNGIVSFSQSFYVAIQQHTTSTANRPPNTSFWEIWEGDNQNLENPVRNPPESRSPPSTPSTPTLVSATQDSITVSVTAVPGAATYLWRVSDDPTVNDNDYNQSSTSNQVVLMRAGNGFGSPLTAGRNYYIDVAASNSVGTSDYSLDLTARTQTPTESPDPMEPLPTNPPGTPNTPVVGIIRTDTSLSFVVTAVTGADSYEWQISTDSSFPAGDTITKGNGMRSDGFTGMNPGTTYYVRVRASNVVGNSSWSNTLTTSTTGTPQNSTQTYFVVTDTGTFRNQLRTRLPSNTSDSAPSDYIQGLNYGRFFTERSDLLSQLTSRAHLYTITRTQQGSNWSDWTITSDGVFEGAWMSGVHYSVRSKDHVSYSGEIYEVRRTHTSTRNRAPDQTFGATYWTQVS